MATNGTQSPYPSAHKIEDMFHDSGNNHEGLIAIIDDNVHVKIMGQDHHFSGEQKGKEAFLKNIKAEFDEVVNTETVKYEVLNVVGGGNSPWAAVEGKVTAKSTAGKKYVHDHAYFIRFNEEGKIVRFRAYYDTHHIHKHAVEQGRAAV